jgi:hypothetical protein
VRWKLLIITSLVAAILSAGGIYALVYLMEGWSRPLSAQPGLIAGVIGSPLLLGILATIFVYRHTARRRKLQAMLTALISIILTVAVLIFAQIFLSRPADGRRELPPTPHNVS